MSTYIMFQRPFSKVLFNMEKALIEALNGHSESPTDSSTRNPFTVGPWNIE